MTPRFPQNSYLRAFRPLYTFDRSLSPPMSALRSIWKPLAAASIPVTAGIVYLNYTPTFEIPIRARNAEGKTEMRNQAFPLLTHQEVERRLHEKETLGVHNRTGITWKHTTSSLASNDPIEDASSDAIIQRDPTDPAAPGDYLFFSVFDGHSGFYTSQLLSKILIKGVAMELSQLANPGNSSESSSLLQKLQPWSSASSSSNLSDGNPQHVAQVIQNAFSKLDNELTSAPLTLLANNLDEESKKTKTLPDLSQHPLALTSMLPAISGSCALTAVVDVAHRDLYISSTGDCRAVAGIWQVDEDGRGSWKCDVLSEDQTGRNPNELKRMQSEHPVDEANNVIMNGRVLGGLEPTRAFGDARYKWTRGVQEALSKAFLEGNNKPLRPPPKLFKTPPYVTATPVVTHRKLRLPDSVPSPSTSTASSSASSTDGKQEALKFIVLATDGLFDQLSSEEVVSLVGGHLQGLKGHIPKSDLDLHVPLSSETGGLTIEGKGTLREDRQNKDSSSGSAKSAKDRPYWAFTDSNVSTHLIRNALGGGNPSKLAKMMSIPAPHSRRFRDDITVTVVWWEEGGDGEITSGAKAKL